jgi:DnaJ-class molecular chaperone
MPQHAPSPRVCRDCDGFPIVAITTGTRHHDGTRATLRVTCPTCQGSGHATPAAGLARLGR